MLPEYEGWNATLLHKESEDILDYAIIFAFQQRANIVLETTMSEIFSSIYRLQPFLDAGYRTEAHYMYLQPHKAAERAIRRFYGKAKGRYVPIDIILAMKENEKNFDEIKELVDSWSLSSKFMIKKKVKVLAPIQPSVALIREYQKALKPLIERMAHSVEYCLKTPFEEATELQEPQAPQEAALMDASPAARMESRLKKIKRKYQKEFNKLAPKIAKHIVAKTQQDVSRRLRNQLVDIMTVDTTITRRVNNVMMAYRAQNLSYIRNIPQRYFVKVEGEIMRCCIFAVVSFNCSN